MKAVVRIALVCLFVFALGFLQVPQAASAGTAPPTPLAGGTWEYIGVEGSLVPLDLEANPAPDGLQVMDWKMLKVAKPVQVCHPFRAGQFGWYAEVRLLKDGVWMKVPTTQGWIPEVDGRYMACANLPSAGTYALFGGFTEPADAVMRYCNYPIYARLEASAFQGIYWLTVSLPIILPDNTLVTYKIFSDDLPGTVLTGLSGSAIANQSIVYFWEDITFDIGFIAFLVEVELPGCYAYAEVHLPK